MQTPWPRRRRWLSLLLVTGLLLACQGLQTAPAAPNDNRPATPLAAPTSAGPPTPTGRPVPGGVAGERSLGDAYIPELGNTGYLVQHYDLALTLDPLVAFVDGRATIRAISTFEQLRELSLDFVGYDIAALTVNGRSATFTREGRKLIITLPVAATAGERLDMAITYQGIPVIEPSPFAPYAEHLGLHFVGNGTLYALAEPDGARYWFPANDHPRDKATFSIEVTVPQGLTGIANGILTSEAPSAMPDGRPATTFTWRHDRPMATYLALVAVGDYVRHEGVTPGGVPMRSYIAPSLETAFAGATGNTAEALDWMSAQLGPYPFERFGFVTAAVPRVSMETQTMVLLSEGMIGERVIIHELAHMWFGNWVSLDSWADMWRNEGFATYFEILWFNRHDPEQVALEMAGLETAVAEQSLGLPLNELPPEMLFSFESYVAGAVFIHELHNALGDEAFFNGLRLYLARHGGGTASNADFQAAMESAAGRSLDDTFNRWLTLP